MVLAVKPRDQKVLTRRLGELIRDAGDVVRTSGELVSFDRALDHAEIGELLSGIAQLKESIVAIEAACRKGVR